MKLIRWTGLIVGVTALVATALPSTARAGECFVSPSGNDATAIPGNKDYPYRTITRPIVLADKSHRAQCNTIVLDSGVYEERVLIANHRPSPGQTTPLIIKAALPFSTSDPTAGAFIRGWRTPVNTTLARQAAIAIYDSSYIEIRGLHIEEDANYNCTSVPDSSSKCNSAGIDIRNLTAVVDVGQGDSSHHITITGNEFANIKASTVLSWKNPANQVLEECLNRTPCVRRYDAVPLDIYSERDEESESTHHIEVIDNVFRDSDLNSDINGTPALLVSRNVENVRIEGNWFHDLAPTSTVVRLTLGITVRGERFNVVDPQPQYVEVNSRARKVIIRNNRFEDIQGTAVFVQSANSVLIERNRVERTDYGVQIATEGTNALSGSVQELTRSRMVWVRDNILRDVHTWAIDVGQKVDHSPVDDIFVTSNTIVRGEATPVDPAYPTHVIVLRPGIGGHSVFANNISELRGASLTCQASGQPAGCNFLALWSASSTTMTSHHNLWDEGDGPMSTVKMFCKYGFACTAFPSFLAPTGPETAGVHDDPVLSGTYTIPSGSPARDAGNSAYPLWMAPDSYNAYLDTFGSYIVASQYPASYPEVDHAGNPRVVGAAQDIGAHEYQP